MTQRNEIARRGSSHLGTLRHDPFDEMRRFRGLFDNLFDSFFDMSPASGLASRGGAAWNPAMNVYKDGNDLVVEVAVPGVRKEDLDLQLEGDMLTISGHAKSESEDEQPDYYRREMFSGRFTRSIRVPEGVDAEAIKAECKEGVLKVRLPLPPQARAEGRRIQVD